MNRFRQPRYVACGGRYDKYGSRPGPTGYIGWQNGFLGIDSWTS
jgi:hypothetical protein